MAQLATQEHTTAATLQSAEYRKAHAKIAADKVASITKQEITVWLGQGMEGGRVQLQARWQLCATLRWATISTAALGARPALAYDK